MNFLVENWYIGVAILAILFVLGIAFYVFVKLPTSKQMDKVREFLLLAVVQAEIALGSETGRLKLQFVHNLFVSRYVWISRVLSYKTFEVLVSEALETMREMLATSKAVNKLIYPDMERLKK